MTRKLTTKTIEAFAGIGAALAACDGVDQKEIAAFLLAAEDLGIDEEVAEKALDDHLAEIEADPRRVDSLLRDSCEAVPAGHRRVAMELAVHMVMADHELSVVEIWRLTATRILLGVSEETLLMMVANEVANDDAMKVSAVNQLDLLK